MSDQDEYLALYNLVGGLHSRRLKYAKHSGIGRNHNSVSEPSAGARANAGESLVKTEDGSDGDDQEGKRIGA